MSDMPYISRDLDTSESAEDRLIDDLNETMPYVVEQYNNMFNTGVTDVPAVKCATVEDFIMYALKVDNAYGYERNKSERLRSAKKNYATLNAFYDYFNYQVSIKDKTLESQNESIYAVCHEAAHGITEKMGLESINKAAKFIEEQIKCDFLDSKSLYLRDIKIIPCKTISEGLAEYMAINMILNNPDNNPEINKAKEIAKSGKEEYEGDRDLAPILIECFSMIEKKLEDPNLENINDLDNRFKNVLKFTLGLAPYLIGYNYVSSQIEQGKTISDIISNIPQTLEEMLPEEYTPYGDKDALFNDLLE